MKRGKIIHEVARARMGGPKCNRVERYCLGARRDNLFGHGRRAAGAESPEKIHADDQARSWRRFIRLFAGRSEKGAWEERQG